MDKRQGRQEAAVGAAGFCLCFPAGLAALAERRDAQVDGETSWHGKTSLQISLSEQRICNVDVPWKGKAHLGALMFLPTG